MQSRFNTILKILMDHYDKIMTIPGNINVLSDTNEKINNRKNVGLCFGLNPSIYCVAYSWGSVFRHYKVIFFKHRRVIGFLCQQMQIIVSDPIKDLRVGLIYNSSNLIKYFIVETKNNTYRKQLVKQRKYLEQTMLYLLC